MNSEKSISIIIVNYKNYDLTAKCIQSVFDNTKGVIYEIIVIDNSSPNESYIKLVDKFGKYENVRIVENKRNDGFGAANNIAAKIAKYDNILFLNPDVVIIKDAIEKMLARYNDEVGIMGCQLLNADLTVQHSCRRFIKFSKFIKARTPLKKLISNRLVEEINDEYLMKDFNHDKEKNVDWIMGSCMLISKKNFFDIGGFSKEYFMYFEDVDLCYKVHKINKQVLYYPKAKMIHLHEQQSIKKINKLSFIHFSSMIKFYKKYNR